MARKNEAHDLAARKAGGWTLIELLVAVAVAGILLAALGGVATLARRAIEGWEQKIAAAGRLRLLAGRLEKDLLFAAPRPAGGAASFTGAPEEISFYTAQGARFDGDAMVPGMRRVRVRFSAADGAVDRLEAPLRDASPAAQPLILLDGVRAAAFSFLGKEGWTDQWTSEAWPRVIRLRGICRDGPRREVSFEKTFYPIQP